MIAVIICDHLMKNKRHHLLSRNFNGPFRLPIIGNILLYFNKKPEGKKNNIKAQSYRLELLTDKSDLFF